MVVILIGQILVDQAVQVIDLPVEFLLHSEHPPTSAVILDARGVKCLSGRDAGFAHRAGCVVREFLCKRI